MSGDGHPAGTAAGRDDARRAVTFMAGKIIAFAILPVLVAALMSSISRCRSDMTKWLAALMLAGTSAAGGGEHTAKAEADAAPVLLKLEANKRLSCPATRSRSS